jgi:hypothetical protein
MASLADPFPAVKNQTFVAGPMQACGQNCRDGSLRRSL